MNEPATFNVRVGALDIPVTCDLLEDGGNCLYGSYQEFPEGSIHLLRTMQGRMRAQVLLHECLHVIDQSQLLGLKERQVQVLEHALSLLLRDNPELFRPLLED